MNIHIILNILGIVILSTGFAVMLGWFFAIDDLKSILPNGPTMKFGTALSFFCTGIALLLIVQMRKGKITLAQIGLPALSLIIIMFLTVNTVSVILGSDISLAMLFMKEPESPTNTTPSRPSLGTLTNFTLIASSFYLLLTDFAKIRKILVAIGITISAIGGLAIIGFALDAPFLYYHFENISNAMAIHTSALFLLVGAGMILIGKSNNQITHFVSAPIKVRLITLFLILSTVPISFLGIMTYLFIRDLDILSHFSYSYVIIGIIGISTSVLFTYLITRQIVKPITDLKNTALTISKGNLEIKAKENTTDEVGQLAKTFNVMVEELKTTTKLRLETEKLRQMDKEKEEFSAMITHELKTPLIPISGYSELFLDGSLGELTDTQKEKMHVIYDNSIHLMNLIQDILDARKMDLGKLKLDLQETSVKEIVKRSTDIFRPITNRKNITVYDNTEDIVVRCDPERILQVLTNIISNAVKFVPAHNGTISINSRITDGLVMLSIEDNGIGIPKEKQTDLFKKFYQVDKALTRKSGGTGLGLAISRGIIESHGGKIWVESEQNHGTTICFTMPRGLDQ